MDDAARRALGARMREKVLGEHVARLSASSATDFNREFRDFVTRYAWGEIWPRPGLDLRTRRLLVLAMMIALGRADEIEAHASFALDQGIAEDEIKEVILQAIIYCGVPAASLASDVVDGLLASRNNPPQQNLKEQ